MITKHGYDCRNNGDDNDDDDDNPKKEVLTALSRVLCISKRNIIGDTNIYTNIHINSNTNPNTNSNTSIT
jgi:hypothetical protein